MCTKTKPPFNSTKPYDLTEVLFRLRVVRATDYLGPEYDDVIQETLELKRIMGSLARKSTPKTRREPTPSPLRFLT